MGDSSGLDFQKPWHSMTSDEQEAYSSFIYKWLDENYEPSESVLVLCQLVYLHYARFCTQQEVSTLNKLLLRETICKKFPSVTPVCAYRGETNWYYEGLDIKKTSDEYESVSKGRKVKRQPSTQKRKLEVDEAESSAGSSSARTGNDSKSWNALPTETKAKHQEQIGIWLEDNYELSPCICLPRAAVYDHYLSHCQTIAEVPAPQAKFGRALFKKFSKTKTRRLGNRGNSRYFYMGIDIREESSAFDAISSERIVSTVGKPKTSRV